jgi:hypothetical protein
MQSKQKTSQISPQEKLRCMIHTIELALEKYEENASVDKWNVMFPIGSGYEGKTFVQIREIHEQLLKSGSGISKLKLLNFVERGRLYDFLKNNSDEKHGNWSEICVELDVCRRTVDRYIDFFLIIETYPRLLICELSFEQLMSNYNKLNEYFNNHDPLAAKLKMPLKATQISGSGEEAIIITSHHMPGGKDESPVAPEKLESSWDPEWSLVDELFESM